MAVIICLCRHNAVGLSNGFRGLAKRCKNTFFATKLAKGL